MVLKKVTALEQIDISKPTVLSIGVFDGVHLGHKQLVQKLVSLASDHKRVPAVLFFSPSPRRNFERRNGSVLPILT